MDEFQKLQQEHPFWLPWSYAYEKMFPAIIQTALFCTIIYYIISPPFINMFFSDDTSSSSEIKKIKGRYQFTNFCFNIVIGGLGIYYEYWIIPTLPSYHAKNAMEKVSQHETEFYLMSAMQLGYQLWALPIGIYCVQESYEMIFHHLGVVLSATLSGFAYVGFRYWTPYFYGVMEISSIPLAIMNAFKDNREWMQRYKFIYLLTRAAFSFSFLYIRVYMWLQIGPRYLLQDFFFFLTVRLSIEKAFLLIQFVLGLFLGFLQLYWGVLVSKGMISWFVKNIPRGWKWLLRKITRTVNKKQV